MTLRQIVALVLKVVKIVVAIIETFLTRQNQRVLIRKGQDPPQSSTRS
jgi:hypothetical protein